MDPVALAALWREAARHERMEDAVEGIAAVVAGHVRSAGLVVARVDGHGRRLVVVAAGGVSDGTRIALGVDLPDHVAWSSFETQLDVDGIATVSRAEIDRLLPGLLSGEIGAGTVVGRLRCTDGARGLFLLLLDAAGATPGEVGVARALAEPLQAAFGHDPRVVRSSRQRTADEGVSEAQFQSFKTGRDEIIGARSGLRQVMERVGLVARSDVPVLILGETGTGKEVIARAIHGGSPRRAGPFVRVNCGAIPSELIDSQLFGHEKGSFTGAVGIHRGWFERADGGTLFLDEIGELPPSAQVRLLRVLQDHQVERVGGIVPIAVDVRIVAATHRDLSAMVENRSFREDLWYRVNGFPIVIPPLRQRPEDIPLFARSFASRAADRFGLAHVQPSDEHLRLLSGYHWPGNIRELGAVIDRAAILGGGRSLDIAVALGLGRPSVVPSPPDMVTLYEVIPETISQGPLDAPADAAGAFESLAEAMKRHIERALERTDGRIEGKRGAACLLDINPHTLRARMRKLRIDPNRFRR